MLVRLFFICVPIIICLLKTIYVYKYNLIKTGQKDWTIFIPFKSSYVLGKLLFNKYFGAFLVISHLLHVFSELGNIFNGLCITAFVMSLIELKKPIKNKALWFIIIFALWGITNILYVFLFGKLVVLFRKADVFMIIFGSIGSYFFPLNALVCSILS